MASIPDNYEAISLLEDMNDPELTFQAHHGLAVNLVLAERYEEAEEPLTVARDLSNEYGHPLLRHQLELLEGMVLQGEGEFEEAERAFLKARAGMIALKRRGYAALVSLEFAVLRFRQGKYLDAAALASEAFPLFGLQAIGREARAALGILRSSILAGRLTEEILVQVRDQLRRLNMNPSSSLDQDIIR